MNLSLFPNSLEHSSRGFSKSYQKTQIDTDLISSTLSSHGYRFCEFIGIGSSAMVARIWSEKYQQDFAAKIYSLTNPTVLKAFSTEIKSLQSLIHPNIILIYGHFSDKQYFYIILEYCPFGNLSYNTDKFRRNYMELARQLLDAFAYIHSQNISHSDIKPGNILIDRHMNLKIADFGLSYIHHLQSTSLDDNIKGNYADPQSISLRRKAGSKYFVAPELISDVSYDPFKADVYSLGTVFFVMLTDHLPISPSRLEHQSEEFIQNALKKSIWVQNDDTYISLVTDMLIQNPERRPTMKQLLAKYFELPSAITKSPISNILSIRQHSISSLMGHFNTFRSPSPDMSSDSESQYEQYCMKSQSPSRMNCSLPNSTPLITKSTTRIEYSLSTPNKNLLSRQRKVRMKVNTRRQSFIKLTFSKPPLADE